MSMYLSGVTWPLPCSTRYLCTEIFMCCLRDVAGSLPWHVTRWCWCFMHQASPGSLTPSFSTKLSTGPSTKPHALIGHQIQSEDFSLSGKKKSSMWHVLLFCAIMSLIHLHISGQLHFIVFDSVIDLLFIIQRSHFQTFVTVWMVIRDVLAGCL